jgi:hypothetical protein
MFRISAISKVKVAGVVAAGALTLGAAGAYAATNAKNTIPVNGATTNVTFNGLSLTALPGAPALPTTQFKNQGECVSWFAQHKQFALTTNGGLTTTNGSTRLAKSYHGKLMAQIGAVCKTAASNATTSDSSATETETSATETETADATDKTDTADKTDSTDKADKADKQNGQAHSAGHGHSDVETND